MSHDHHGHHHHGDVRSKKVLFAGILNISFTIIEIIGGILTNSVAILSDALHDLGDSISLITAYVAEKQAERPADAKRTFGYKRLSLFSALFTAVVLLVGSIFILIEAVQRLFAPEPVMPVGMIGIAVFGIVVNYIAYLRLRGGHSANEKVLSLHLLEDVLGWVAVLVGAVIIYFTDLYLIDPLLTIGYTAFILWHVVRGLREVVNILLQGTPSGADLDAIGAAIVALPEVATVHDVHVWSLDGEHNVFTGHVVVQDVLPEAYPVLRAKVVEQLQQYHIVHATIEIERVGECPDNTCGWQPEAAHHHHH
ncbi:cation transporter [Candidatus Nomurabacteria bacterium]|nr:cation transporter [Candidatus Nomurabacteria bacterium]